MMIKRMRHVLCAMLAIGCTFYAEAQQSARFRPTSDARFLAADLAAHNLYALAAANARASLNASSSGLSAIWPSEELRARYILAVTGLKTGQEQGVDSALSLLTQLVDVPLKERLSLAVARYYFVQGQLAQSIPYYESAGIANLDNREIADAKFELAYAYFNNRQFVAANTLFNVMKEVPGKYYSPGNYYYGLLAYNDGDYKAALKSFDRISNEPIYRPVVPYYMAEILYFMGERDKALAEALRLIQLPEKLYYDNELHLLAAQCLFEAGRYGEALPYFEHYYQNTDKIRKEELYEMGYAYYRVNEWKNAIEKFKPLSATRDSLGQTAMYLLGDCYLKAGDKESARNAFGICAGMAFNAGQREASLLLHGKLSYELGYSDEAMRSVRTLLTDYTGSKYTGEAKVLQSQLYLQTSNYQAAYDALAEGENGTPEYRQIRQRAAFGYAMQELQRQRLREGSGLLTDAIANDAAPEYTAAALFWKGEVAYRLHQYDSAVYYSEQYLAYRVPAGSGPAVSSAVTREHGALTLGYAAMETRDFKKAQQAFSAAKGGGTNTATAYNASLREADAYFMQKDFVRAAPLYAAAATGRGADADYARLQSAIIAGLNGDNPEKARLLQSVLNSSSSSAYAAEARYELGVTQLSTNRYSDAIATLQPLATGRIYPAFAARSLLKIGTAYQQMDADDKALETFNRLIRDWSAAPERADALSAVKAIYIERNQPDAYSKLLQDLNMPQATDDELEGAYYNAAEAQYAGGKWAEAQTGFARYLQVYPSGKSSAKARYYLANSYYNQKAFRPAAAAYDTVLQGPWNAFSEDAARKAAELAVADTAWAAANRYYSLLSTHATTPDGRLVAATGQMRMAARLSDAQAAAQLADTVLSLGPTPTVRDEARLLVARRSMLNGRQPEADSVLRTLQESTNGAVAAEARYYSAQALLTAGKLKDAETAASRNIKLSTGYEYWVIKTYLLLGDILIREKDYFNARATLQSVAQHASIPALREEAKKKLDELKSGEGSKLSND